LTNVNALHGILCTLFVTAVPPAEAEDDHRKPRYKKSEHVKTYYQVNHLSEGNLC